MRAVLLPCEFYLGICLTTEEKVRKTFSQVNKNLSQCQKPQSMMIVMTATTMTTLRRLRWYAFGGVRLRLKCDGTRTETRFRLTAKRTSPFKSAGASVQSTTGSGGVRISGSNAGYTMFRGSVKSTGFPLHSPVSPSLPLPCVTVCHHISTGLYISRQGKGKVHLRTGYEGLEGE